MCACSNPNPKAAPPKTVQPPLRLKLRRFRFAKPKGAEEKARGADKKLARYRFDPEGYIVRRLKWTPWRGTAEAPGQCDILDAYALALRQQHEKRDWEQGKIADADLQSWKPGQIIQNRIRVEAGHSVGKCVITSDVITLSDGTRITAGELIGKSFNLLTLVNGVPTEVEARAEFNAVETVYELLTDTGKRVIRNAAHPFRVGIADFRSGYRPAITDNGFVSLSNITAGNLIAVAETLPAFGNICIPDNQIKILAYLLGDGGYTRSSVRFSQMAGPQLDEFISCVEELGCRVQYIGQYDWIVYGQGSSPTKRQRGCNPLLNLLREHGMMNRHSRDKRVPVFVYNLPRKKLQLFLNRLFSTDGWASVDKTQQREIGFCSASKGLVEDIAYLLQKMGVHSRVTRREKVNAWCLNIKDANDQMAFVENIGIYGKEASLNALAALAAPIRDRKLGEIAKRPDRPRWCHKNAPAGTRWEKVVSVTPLPEPQSTVAIEVPEHHTYLTQFWEHNTKLSSGVVNHFFDCFAPSIIYTFAPSWRQIHDLLWKEIKTDRRGKNLPGRILDLKLEIDDNHFATGMATSDAGGKGTERVQGQHGEYLLFILDEAEGIPDFVWGAIDSMASGGIVIILMLANPRTRSSKFYKSRTLSTVQSFRMSCIGHPNVRAGKEVVPGAVLREYVSTMIEKHCEVTNAQDDDQHTFTLPFDVQVGETVHPAGTLFLPNAEFLFRVLGVAPANIADNTLITVGRLEAACKRVLQMPEPEEDEDASPEDGEREDADEEESEDDSADAPIPPHKQKWAYLGNDIAGFGKDCGTLYIHWERVVWRAAQLWKQDYDDYARAIREEALSLKERGCTHLSLRIDAGGGFGQGVISHLKKDMVLREAFPGDRLVIHEVHFGSPAKDKKAYANCVTELYAQAGETLKGVRVENPPDELEEDLCERIYEWVNDGGVEVKRLEEKKAFKKRHQGRSPDDGDGFVLSAAPEFLFGKRQGRVL